MLGRRRTPEDGERRAVEAALSRLGCHVHRWTGPIASVRHGDDRFHLSVDTIRAQIGGDPSSIPERALALRIADAVNLPADRELLEDFAVVEGLLRPRVVGPADLTGPQRTMVRRELFGDLLATITVGSGSRRTPVTTRELDAWSMPFEDVMLVAKENYLSRVDTTALHDVDGAPGLLAFVHESEPAASAALVLEELIPGVANEPGVVFSMPGEDVLLLLPLEEDAGAEGLVGAVQATFALGSDRAEPLSDAVFWRLENEVRPLPMTRIQDGDSHRVHLEAEGVMRELLERLGAIEPGTDEEE